MWLEIISGSKAGERYQLDPDQFVQVGRSDELAVTVPNDDELSRNHFAVKVHDAQCFVKDLGSSNGTYINGQLISGFTSLQIGDRIEAGNSIFVLRDGQIQTVTSEPAMDVVTVRPNELRDTEDNVITDHALENDTHDFDLSAVMEINNDTLFQATTMLWEDTQNNPKLSVIIKGTFCIRNNAVAEFSDHQSAIFSTDYHYGDDPLASVIYETDMVPYKPRSDIILVGNAYAPEGKPLTELNIALKVGHYEKMIRAIGDRFWYGKNISTPKPFKTMPILYERAYGGFDEAASEYCQENLVGVGYIGRSSKKGVDGKCLPNLEDPADLIVSWDARPKPVGFGFYGRGCQPRLGLAGTYDDYYRQERAPAYPIDYSYAVFNAAHPDLQVDGYLRGDEPVGMLNLCTIPHLQFSLSGIRPSVTVTMRMQEKPDITTPDKKQLKDVKQKQLNVHLDTLVFAPSKGIFYEVFRGVCSLTELNPEEIIRIDITNE